MILYCCLSAFIFLVLSGCSGRSVQRPNFEFVGETVKAFPAEVIIEDHRRGRIKGEVSSFNLYLPLFDYKLEPSIIGKYRRVINQEIMGVFSTSGREIRVVVQVYEAQTTSDKGFFTGD